MKYNCTLRILEALADNYELTAKKIGLKVKTTLINTYKILNKLEIKGQVTYFYRKSPYDGRTIRYYRLTAKEILGK